MSAFDDISAPIEQRIATGFARIFTVMRSQAWQRAQAEGLTPTQADILALMHGRGAALRLSAIAAELSITPATASEAVSTLTSKGLVEKVRASDDRRALALSLTARGRELAAQAGASESLLQTVVQGFGPQEKEALLSLLVKLIRSMQERGDIPVTRICLSCDYYSPNKDGDPAQAHYCHLVKSPFADRHIRLDCPEHACKEQPLKFLAKPK